MKKIYIHSGGFQRGFGCIGALLQASLAISDSQESNELLLGPVYFLVAVLFLATALISSLGFLQAGLFLGLSALETFYSLNYAYGLGFAVVGAIILFRRGWFFRKSRIKASLVLVVGCAFLILPILAAKRTPVAFAPAVINAAIYAALVAALAKGRLLSGLAPKKSMLRLAKYKLNSTEIQVVKAYLEGKTVKEMSAETGLAVSTIRNAICTACHKLGMGGRESLLALGERFRVE